MSFASILFGELDKWVPVSKARFSQLQWSQDSASVVATGSYGETIAVTWGYTESEGAGATITTATCIFPSNGKLLVQMPSGTCS